MFSPKEQSGIVGCRDQSVQMARKESAFRAEQYTDDCSARVTIQKPAPDPSYLLSVKISCVIPYRCQREDDAVWSELCLHVSILPGEKKKQKSGGRGTDIKAACLVPTLQACFCSIVIKDRGTRTQ